MPKLPKLFRLPDSLDELDFGIMFLDSLDEPRLQSVTGLLGRTWTLECFQTPWTNLDFRILQNSEPNRFWQATLDPVLGKKRSKECVSILATCNASGDERLPLVFIHKYETPRALKGIEKRSLPVWYYWNSKAWMQKSIFKHYLERLNSKILRENRHIILLIDNARCHESENINSLSNVKVHFLPLNTTSFFQPLDQGRPHSTPIDIFDSINLIADAWKKVFKKTILNSWAKAGILPNNNMEDSECSDNSDYEEDNIGHELQSLIDELGFIDPLAVNDYINIDNRASAEEELSLQEIVDVVKGTNEREIEEKEEQDEISTIVALNSIENVIKYIQQKDLEIGNLEMKNLIKLKKRIFFDNINEKRQSKLNEYFDFNV
ncbi:tigger transposable element-derived protein 4-like [Rhizophagus irregularis DAOM 181602=DAOM 197198]|nr:tigger transposable element-derived protein 4-like [Rhizophagus irregularis DAOM 181602=DAOM 197198]